MTSEIKIVLENVIASPSILTASNIAKLTNCLMMLDQVQPTRGSELCRLLIRSSITYIGWYNDHSADCDLKKTSETVTHDLMIAKDIVNFKGTSQDEIDILNLVNEKYVRDNQDITAQAINSKIINYKLSLRCRELSNDKRQDFDQIAGNIMNDLNNDRYNYFDKAITHQLGKRNSNGRTEEGDYDYCIALNPKRAYADGRIDETTYNQLMADRMAADDVANNLRHDEERLYNQIKDTVKIDSKHKTPVVQPALSENDADEMARKLFLENKRDVSILDYRRDQDSNKFTNDLNSSIKLAKIERSNIVDRLYDGMVKKLQAMDKI